MVPWLKSRKQQDWGAPIILVELKDVDTQKSVSSKACKLKDNENLKKSLYSKGQVERRARSYQKDRKIERKDQAAVLQHELQPK